MVQLGHCHPRVVEAIQAQAARLMHVGNLYYTAPSIQLAKRLADCSLGGRVFFTNSGAEAIECALKLARKRKRGGEVVVLEGGFHGRTYGALSATPQESKQEPFAPLVPGFRAVSGMIRRLVAAINEETAAVLIEPIRGIRGPPIPRSAAAAGACATTMAPSSSSRIRAPWAAGRLGVDDSGSADVMTGPGLGGGFHRLLRGGGPSADVLEPGITGPRLRGGRLSVLPWRGLDAFRRSLLQDFSTKGSLAGACGARSGRARPC